jgi:acetyl esterase/lipase
MKRMLLVSMMGVGMVSADWENLWKGPAPGAPQPPKGSEVEKGGMHYSNIEVPQMQVYPAAEKIRTGAAVVILPGGGYTWLAADHEGKQYAEWLNQHGITGVVVKYRVSGKDSFGYQFPVPLLDARRAIRTVRARSAEWGVDPHKIGVMGSSAGGHLASMCATMSDEKFKEEGGDEIDKQSCRPDFAILAYPVITMADPYCHKGSRGHLLGKNLSPEAIGHMSTERRVTAKTPPCFLVHASDDHAVPVRNTLEFTAACAAHRVPVVCHVFSQGGHGFGLGRKGDSKQWPGLLAKWLKDHGWGN